MDYFETDSNSSAPKRVPLSLRLPVQVVESVDRYASENRMSKTDAFLHFLRRGMDAERGELRLDQLVMPGHTKVCNPRGHVVAELAEEAEGVLHVELDLNEVVDYRQRSPYLRDRRPDLYDLVLLP